MMNVTLRLTNFRCFEDSEPAVIDVRPGLTAFVGPNNSGKSSLLRMFFELRNLFQRIEEKNSVVTWLRGGSPGFNLQQVPDPSALLCDSNTRSMKLRIEVLGTYDSSTVTAVEYEFPREAPQNVRARFFVGSGYGELTTGDARHAGGYAYSVGDRGINIQVLVEHLRLLANTVYIGPFRNALNEGGSNYYDLSIGTSFIELWKQWKNGDNRKNNRAIKAVEEGIRHLFGFDQLEINPAADGKSLRVFVDGHSFNLQEQGSGLAQFILSFGAAATRSPSLILIDEPELNLHPSLQVDFLTTLSTFAGEATIFSTHSIGLARSVADTIYSVQRRKGHSLVRRFEQTPNLVEFAGELGFSTFRELGFDRLLLVEGPTDVRTIQQLLRKLRKDHRIVVFPLLGHAFASADHVEALAELTRVTSADRIAALVDSERTAAEQPPDGKRRAFAAACERLGFAVHLTERRAIENYFSVRAIREGVGPAFDALDHYERHGGNKKNWSKSLNWKIAHALDLDEIEGTDLLRFLSEL